MLMSVWRLNLYGQDALPFNNGIPLPPEGSILSVVVGTLKTGTKTRGILRLD